MDLLKIGRYGNNIQGRHYSNTRAQTMNKYNEAWTAAMNDYLSKGACIEELVDIGYRIDNGNDGYWCTRNDLYRIYKNTVDEVVRNKIMTALLGHNEE